MTVRNLSEQKQTEDAPRPWSFRDYLLLGLALGSAILSRSENINVFASPLLDMFAGSVGAALIVDLFTKGREMKNARTKARELRIANGTEEFNRDGEQIIILGGDGSFVVDHMAVNDPRHTIPVFNTHEAAQVTKRLIPVDKEAKYLNLGVAPDGLSVIDTPSLGLLGLKESNAIHTHQGTKAVMVSLGNTFPKEYGFQVEGADDAQAMVLQTRLVEQLEPVVGSSDNCVTIRVDQMYDFPGNRAIGDVLTNRRSDWEASLADNKNMGKVLLLDPWAIVMRSIYETAITMPGSRNDASIAVVLESDSLPATLPFAEDFGIQFLGKNHHFNTLVSVRDFFHRHSKNKRVMANLVMEMTDEAVLAKVVKNQSRVTSDVEETVLDLAKQDSIYIFQTKRATEIAQKLGALNVVCVADCVCDMVGQVVDKVRIGDESVSDIQLWVDNQHNHQKITNRMERNRVRPAKDRLDILNELEQSSNSDWWASLLSKGEFY